MNSDLGGNWVVNDGNDPRNTEKIFQIPTRSSVPSRGSFKASSTIILIEVSSTFQYSSFFQCQLISQTLWQSKI